MPAQTPGKESGSAGGPAAKRRRVELANSTLRKPFRSPLLLGRPQPPQPAAGSSPVSAGAGLSGSGSGSGAGAGAAAGFAASSPSLRLERGRGRGRSASFGLELGESTAGLGLGQSPLRFKTRVGEDRGRERGREIPDSEDEDEDEGSENEGLGNGNDGENGNSGEDTDIAAGTSADLSKSLQTPVPASPSLRTASGEARGGNLRVLNIQLEGRRYPPPTSLKSASASTSTPTRTKAAPPSLARNTGTSLGISHLPRNYRHSHQTPSKKSPISSSNLLSRVGRNPKTPSTYKSTNNPNTPTTTITTKHGKDGTKNEAEDKPPPGSQEEEEEEEEEEDFSTVLESANREIQVEIAEARKKLDVAKQARRIQEKGSVEELEALIEKWKSASRQAAEDLFELIKARVDGMGGGKAWRDSRRRQVRGWGFEEEDDYEKRKRRKKGDDYDEYSDGEDSEEEGQDEDGGDDEKNNEEEEEEDTGFTMAMMLLSLNIEPKVLGWDPGEEKWQD